jgi:hypothetical protein
MATNTTKPKTTRKKKEVKGQVAGVIHEHQRGGVLIPANRPANKETE